MTKRKVYIAHSLSQLRQLYASGIDATLAPASTTFLQESACNDQPIKPMDGSNDEAKDTIPR
jgi:hypothetical protein